MERGRRAKQFAPFDALKGFEETVRREEIVYEPHRVMAVDRQEELNHKLGELTLGETLTVQYFEESILFPGKGHYHTITGKLKDCCIPGSMGGDGFLQVGETEVALDRIWDILREEVPVDPDI